MVILVSSSESAEEFRVESETLTVRTLEEKVREVKGNLLFLVEKISRREMGK